MKSLMLSSRKSDGIDRSFFKSISDGIEEIDLKGLGFLHLTLASPKVSIE